MTIVLDERSCHGSNVCSADSQVMDVMAARLGRHNVHAVGTTSLSAEAACRGSVMRLGIRKFVCFCEQRRIDVSRGFAGKL